MDKIIPGYFIPIWQDIIMNRRNYAIKLISELTLIPIQVLKKAVFYKNEEESKLNSKKVSDISIFMDYKYCIIDMSKEYYKRLVCGDNKCLEDMDLNRRFIKRLKMCISFENAEYLVKSYFVDKGMTDYGFLHIGIKSLEMLKMKNCLTETERMLGCLVADTMDEVKKFDDYDLTSIIYKYQGSEVYKNWFRTYHEYLNCSNLLEVLKQ